MIELEEIRDTSKTNIPQLENVMFFLKEDEWAIVDKTRAHFKMKPPVKFLLGHTPYLMSIVNSEDYEDYERNIKNIIGIISNIYEFDAEDFAFAMRNNGTIWSITLESEAFHKKAIDLEHFLKMTTYLKAILKAVAEQVVLEKGGNKEMVEAYLEGCNLVKMDVEKLEVKMELPAELVFGFEQELLDGKERKVMEGGGEQELLDGKERKVMEGVGEQELLDGKERKVIEGVGEQELLDGKERKVMEGVGEQELLDGKERKVMEGGGEQELLDGKEGKEDAKEAELEVVKEQELKGEKEEKELEYVKEEEVEYVGKKEKTTGKEWKSDLINQRLQEVLGAYLAYFNRGEKAVTASKEQEIAALKSHLAVHDFIEGMALKQVHFSFFNKDYQKEFTLQIKEPIPIAEQTIEGIEEEEANS